MNDDTTPLATYHRAVGGTDPHPVSIDALIGHLDSQLDTVCATAEGRGTLAGAEVFLVSVRELVMLAQSLEGRAAERVEMLRSTAEAVLDGGGRGYEAAMALLDEDAS